MITPTGLTKAYNLQQKIYMKAERDRDVVRGGYPDLARSGTEAEFPIASVSNTA